MPKQSAIKACNHMEDTESAHETIARLRRQNQRLISDVKSLRDQLAQKIEEVDALSSILHNSEA